MERYEELHLGWLGGTQATTDFCNDNVTVIAKDYSILDSLHKVA